MRKSVFDTNLMSLFKVFNKRENNYALIGTITNTIILSPAGKSDCPITLRNENVAYLYSILRIIDNIQNAILNTTLSTKYMYISLTMNCCLCLGVIPYFHVFLFGHILRLNVVIIRMSIQSIVLCWFEFVIRHHFLTKKTMTNFTNIKRKELEGKINLTS